MLEVKIDSYYDRAGFSAIKLILDHLSNLTNKDQFFILPFNLSINESSISWLRDTNISQFNTLYYNSSKESNKRMLAFNLLKGIEVLPDYLRYNINLNDIRMVSRGGDNKYVTIYDNLDIIISRDNSNLSYIKEELCNIISIHNVYNSSKSLSKN